MNNDKIKKILFYSILLFIFMVGVFIILDRFVFSKLFDKGFVSSDWVTIIIGLLTSISTVILGYVSFWQNKTQREDNLRSEKRLREQYEKDKENAKIQYKLQTLNENLNSYIDKLQQINIKLSEKNLQCDLYDFIHKIEYYNSKEEILNNIIFFERTLVDYISLINYVNSTILYNEYYCDELDECIFSLYDLRNEMDKYSKNVLKKILNNYSKEEFIINVNLFKEQSAYLMEKIVKFNSYWQIYFQASTLKFHDIILNNNFYTFNNWRKENINRTNILKKKLNDKEFSEHDN